MPAPVDPPRRPAAVLWTGGKDSALALAQARATLDVQQLVTFVPVPERPFLAHPQALIRAQAEALGLPLRFVPVGEPYAAGYERALDELAAAGLEVVVTGDIDRIDGHDNWIVDRARGRLDVERPLWELDRATVLGRLVDEDWRVVCTLATPACGELELAGRALDAACCQALLDRAADPSVDPAFDATGENGEFHTATLWAPGFRHGLVLRGARVVQGEGFRHLVFDGIDVDPSPAPDRGPGVTSSDPG